MDLVFLAAAGVVVIAFFILVFLPELELRTQSGIQGVQAGAGELGRDRSALVATEKAVGAAAPTSTPADSAPMAGDGTRGAGTASGNGHAAGNGGPAANGGPVHHRHQGASDAPTGLASIPGVLRGDTTGDGPRHAQH